MNRPSVILMGSNPFDVHDLWERMYQETLNFGRKGIVLEAISGLDMALWDILGKATNQHGGRVYNYHLIMAHHNSPIAEYFPPQPGTPYVNEYLWHLWDGEPVAQDGYLTLSEKPGLGVELNQEVVDAYRAEL